MTSPPPSRKVHLSLVSGTGVLLVLGLAVFLNLLGQRFFARFDWTSDNRYSLSQATRTLLRSMEDPVVIRFYLTPGLPQPYESQGRYIQDLLQEFRSASRGKVSLEIIAPTASDEASMEFNRLNLQPARFTQVASDQFQVRQGYMGLVLHYQDKQDVIPFVQKADNLEYELASRLRVMTQTERKRLFFVTNHNEVSPEAMKGGPAGRLFEEFQVVPTSLQKNLLASPPSALFILGPQQALTPEELEVLDDFLATGVPVVVALNRRVVFPESFRSMAQTTGLEPLLEHYGVRVDREFVMDEQSNNLAMRSEQTTFLVKFLPFILASDLNRDHRALESLDVLGFPFGSALSPTSAAPSALSAELRGQSAPPRGDGPSALSAELRGQSAPPRGDGPSALTWTPLARSSKKSWVWPGLYNLDPPSLFNQLKTDPPSKFPEAGRSKDLGPFTLAALVEGSTVTFHDPQRSAPNVKLVVMGTSFFANPQVPNPDGNALFILSLAQWLTQEGSYLSIPPKSSPFRPLRPVADWLRPLIKGLGYFFIPALVVLAGFLHWKNRARMRKSIEAVFRPTERAEGPRA